MLCLDARQEGVRVPSAHREDPGLKLILSLKFPSAINVTSEGVSATLSFGGRPFACFIPFSALWAAYNPHTFKGVVWTGHVPSEVQRDILREPDSVLSLTPQAEVERPAPKLRLIQGGKRRPRTLAGRPKKAHLKIVK